MTSLFDRLTQERGVLCEVCGHRLATDPHHVIYHRRKGHPEYDDPCNICLVCRVCHDTGNVNSRAFKVEWYRSQKMKGYDMDKWLDSLNRRHKEMWG